MRGTENDNGNRFRVTLTYTDGQGYPNTASADIKIGPTRPRVVAAALPTAPLLWTRGQAIPPIDLNEWFRDDDGNTLSYEAVGLPSGVMLSTTGALAGTPAADTVASTSTAIAAAVTVIADDGKKEDGGTATATFSYLINAETTGTLFITSTDDNGDTVPESLTVEIGGVTDDNGLTTTRTYQWKLNDNPIAGATTPTIASSTTAGLVYSVDVGFSDNLGLTTTLTAATTIPAIITLVSTPTVSVSESGQTTVKLLFKVVNVSPEQLVDLPWSDGGVASLAGVDEDSIATVNVTLTGSVPTTLTVMNLDGAPIDIPIPRGESEPDKGIRLRAKVFLEGPLQ